jgi:hypothetical protein
MYWSKFGLFGNDFHFPSGEMRAACRGAVAAAVWGCVFIASMMRDTTAGYNGYFSGLKNSCNNLDLSGLRL